MKRRILTISLIVASLVLLVSVGFAGWIITQNTTGQTEGNFEAYAVDGTGNLTVSAAATQVTFGKPQGDTLPTTTYHWLSLSSMDSQQLSATFTLSWSLNVASGSPISFSLTDEYYSISNPATTGSKDPKLIGGPSYSVSGAGASITGTGSTLTLENYTANTTITVTVEYNWGTCFGGQNPYVYFNALSKDAVPTVKYNDSEEHNYETAQNALTALNTFTTDYGFRVKVEKNEN